MPFLEHLPADAVTQRFAFLGVTGSGKTNAAAMLAEWMFRHKLPFVIIDPPGAWWGLQSSRDGKRPGLPIPIFGGRHGNVPLEREAGAVLANTVASERLSCVVDVSDFSESDKVRFLTDFAERLYRVNQDPLHLFLEEADDYLPQEKVKYKARCLGAFEAIVRRGRARGLGITMITQRSAVLNKNVLTQIGTLFVLRTTAPQDRKAIAAWLEYHGQSRDVLETLAKLESGDAWVWSPQWLGILKRIHFPMRGTFDSGATPISRGSIRKPTTLADIDLGAIQKKMAETIERAKAEDPRELKGKLAALQRDMQAVSKKFVDMKTYAEHLELKIKNKGWAKPKPALRPGDVARVERLMDRMTKSCEKLADIGQAIVSETGNLREVVTKAQQTPVGPAEPVAKKMPSETQPLDRRPARGAPSLTGTERLRAGERRILATLARSHPARRSRTQIGTLSGFTPSGGTFAAYWGTLKRCRFVREDGDGLASITEEGFTYLGDMVPASPQSAEQVVEMWRSALRAGERAMLDVLVRAHPKSVTRERLAEETGFTVSGGTFAAYLGTLRRNGLAQVSGDEVQAGEAIFLLGRE